MGLTVYGGGGKPEEEKTVTAGTSAIEVLSSSGKTMKKVTINPTPSQEKTIDPTGFKQIVLPDDGKVLSKVIINGFDPSLVTWSSGTDEEIVRMVQLADEGKLNLADYWAVGDERQVSLSAIPVANNLESHIAQTVTMVLLNVGGKTLANATPSGRTTCSFIVGLKNGLSNGKGASDYAETGKIHSSDNNSVGWDGCIRRTWCNGTFKDAIPSTLLPIFKQHLNVTAKGTSSITSTDYFALPSEKEVVGSSKYADATVEANLTQFDYYKTTSNRIKNKGNTSAAHSWWTRSPYKSSASYYCSISKSGNSDWNSLTSTLLIAPFGCI